MSMLIRDDGTPFVMGAYREVVTSKKKSLIARRIRSLAEQHGQYACLFHQEPGKYKVVFSNDCGYLLGETIKQYFGQSQNLIFCEALPNSTDVLLVIVRDGNIYLDTRVSPQNLRSKLVPLTTESGKYQIIVSKSAPIKRHPEKGVLALPPELVHSFETLDEPLFPRLSVIQSLKLLPLSFTLKTHRLTRQPLLIFTVTLVMVIFIVFMYYLLNIFQKNTALLSAIPHKPNAYYLYNQALMTPAPQQQMIELLNMVQVLYALPGWTVTHIRYDNRHYQIDVSSEGADLEALRQWANQHGFTFQLTKTAVLTHDSQVPSRSTPSNIYSIVSLTTAIIDQLNAVLHGKRLRINQINHHNKVTEMELTIALQNDAPKTLLLIGDTLKDSPTTIKYFDLALNPGSLSGTIALSVWGK